MKLAHNAIVTPHRAGLYETVRDLVAAERSAGVDAIIVDPNTQNEDRGVPIAGAFVPGDYDVIVNHSGLGKHETRVNGTPIIHCLHGRPASSFELEASGKVGVYSFVRASAANVKYKLWVTFWAEYLPDWELLVPQEKLRAVTPPVDLQTWTPDGPSGYQFHGQRGAINVVCADMWREDKTPYHVVHCFCEFAKQHPGAKLHLYGVQRNKAVDVLLEQVKARGWLGEATGYVTGLEHVYRGATMAISPHRIATRSIREAMACGCPVVHAPGSAHGTMHADPEDPVQFAAAMSAVLEKDYRQTARAVAEREYDSAQTAREMLALVEEVRNGN